MGEVAPEGHNAESRWAERRLTRRGVLEGGLLIAASGFLAAYGGHSGKATAHGSSGKLKQGGSIRVGVVGGSATDKLEAGFVLTGFELMSVNNLYEPLVRRNEQFVLEPRVAESLEPATKTADVWIAKIRPGVEFHNGKSVTAEDVIFTLQRILDPTNPLQASRILSDLDYKNLRALDKRTVKIPLFGPNAAFPDELAEQTTGIVPVGYNPLKPIGSGPFKLVSFHPGRQEVMGKFSNYWETDHPLLDDVTLVNFTDGTAQFNALESGQIDVAFSLANQNIPSVEGNSNLRLLISKSGSFAPIVMRVDRAPFSDVRVRQAFRLIVDRPQMIAQALNGQGWVANDVYSPYDPDYDTSLPQRRQDIDRAKHLLRQAGHANGLNVTLTTGPANGPSGVAQAQVFQQQAKAAGVHVRLSYVTAQTFNNRYGEWPFTQSDFPAVRTYLPQVGLTNVPGAPANDSHWSPANFVRLVHKARAELDPAKRKKLLWAAQRIQYDNSGYVIPYFVNQVDAYSAKLGGFEPSRAGNAVPRAMKSVGYLA